MIPKTIAQMPTSQISDRSPVPGWQLTTYGLAFNTYSGAGTPPFSSARVYTFRSVSGGVSLFS